MNGTKILSAGTLIRHCSDPEWRGFITKYNKARETYMIYWLPPHGDPGDLWLEIGIDYAEEIIIEKD